MSPPPLSSHFRVFSRFLSGGECVCTALALFCSLPFFEFLLLLGMQNRRTAPHSTVLPQTIPNVQSGSGLGTVSAPTEFAELRRQRRSSKKRFMDSCKTRRAKELPAKLIKSMTL
ncbi:unnamed protein product [Calypogeia fissa]